MQGLERGQIIDIQLTQGVSQLAFGWITGFKQLQLKGAGRTGTRAWGIRV
jgi:hypothetical protein